MYYILSKKIISYIFRQTNHIKSGQWLDFSVREATRNDMKFQTRQLFRKMFDSFIAERLERDGLCWLLKLSYRKRGLKEYKWKDPSLVGSLGLSCRYKGSLSYLDCSSESSTKYFCPHRKLFRFICPPPPSKLRRQSCWVACLFSMCPWFRVLRVETLSTYPVPILVELKKIRWRWNLYTVMFIIFTLSDFLVTV